MSRFTPLYTFFFSFVAGAALFSFFEPGLYTVLFLFILAAVIWLYHQSKKTPASFFIALVLFSAALGGFRFSILEWKGGDHILDQYLGEYVTLGGVITDEPSERETTTRIIVTVEAVSDETLQVKTKLVTSIPRFPEFHYGDRIELTGTLKPPQNFETDRGRIFDYVHYLAKDRIFYTLSSPAATLISSGHGNIIKSQLFKMKQAWLSRVEALIPDPYVSLLGGLVVGSEKSLGKKLEDDFRTTGIIHIVVLSGYNVTIVAEAIMDFLSFLPELASLSLGAVSIILFAILTGGSATIIRASIMAVLVLIARATKRTTDVAHALYLAAFFMVLHNPMIVVYDPSFQLSFLATLGLIYLAPAIEKRLHMLPARWQIREFAVATIATQIFVLPLLLYMTGAFSVYALPVNLLVLGFIPMTMFFGFFTGVIGFVSNILAFPLATVSYLLLKYELGIVEFFAHLPLASFAVPAFPFGIVVLCYVVYGFIVWKLLRVKTVL